MSAPLVELPQLAGTHSYIGIAPCGCARAFAHDVPGCEKDTAEFVADMISGGMKVDRVTRDDASTLFVKNPACAIHARKATA